MTLPILIEGVRQFGFVFYWPPVLGWMAVIVILRGFLNSSLPSCQSVTNELVRNGIHVVKYGMLALVLHLALKRTPRREPSSRNHGPVGMGWELYLSTFLITALYAILDEVEQSLVLNREPSPMGSWTHSLGSLLVLSGIAVVSRSSVEPMLKRPFDIILSSVGLLLLLPLWLAIALAIKLEDRGPVLHSEERWGRDGAVFRIYKFRTTAVNLDSTVPIEVDLGHRRFTRTGKFLRARGIDELPQLLNILKGEMSFVGPRPLAVEDVTVQHKKEYAADTLMTGFHERLSVRPGLTGIAQVFGSRYLSHRSKFRYDLLYVRNQSFLLDLRLLTLSLWVSIRGKWEAKGEKL